MTATPFRTDDDTSSLPIASSDVQGRMPQEKNRGSRFRDPRIQSPSCRRTAAGGSLDLRLDDEILVRLDLPHDAVDRLDVVVHEELQRIVLVERLQDEVVV